MNPEIKKKWVKALRSRDYQQGTRALHVKRDGTETFCCLGVLCDLAAKEGVAEPSPVSTVAGVTTVMYDKQSAFLPRSVQEWSEIPSNNGYLSDEPDVVVEGEDGVGSISFNSLVGLNDEGATFAQIADIIEKHF
jgi:hypothetical protein